MPSREKFTRSTTPPIAKGGKCEGTAGARGDAFDAGYFRDLDGNKLCAFRSPGA